MVPKMVFALYLVAKVSVSLFSLALEFLFPTVSQSQQKPVMITTSNPHLHSHQVFGRLKKLLLSALKKKLANNLAQTPIHFLFHAVQVQRFPCQV